MGLPYLPLFIADFDADTAHLTIEEDGAYNRLLRICWRTPGCSIPNDDAWIRRQMRADGETYERVVRPILEEFFTLRKGRLHNARLTAEFKKANATSKRRATAGRKGGLAGKGPKTKGKTSSPAEAGLKPGSSTHTYTYTHIKEPPFIPPSGGEPTLFGDQDDPASQTEPAASQSAPKAEKRSRSASDRGSLLPPDWRLPKEWGDWAMAHGLSEFEARREAEKFRDYWTALSGAKARKKDWFATWRNWVRTAVERRGPQGTGYRRRNYGV